MPAHVQRDDLVSAAMYALAVSAKSFNATLGVPFARFATIRMRGALTDELRSMDWASRGARSRARELESVRAELVQLLGHVPSRDELCQAMGISPVEMGAIESDVARASVVSLHALAPDDGAEALPVAGDGPETLLLRREQIGYLRDAVAELPERLQIVVTGYFFEQRRMADIADELGVTESRISQLRAEALVILRSAMHAFDEPTVTAPAPVARGRAATTQAYCAAVASRSTLAGRLAATTVLGEAHPASEPLRVAN